MVLVVVLVVVLVMVVVAVVGVVVVIVVEVVVLEVICEMKQVGKVGPEVLGLTGFPVWEQVLTERDEADHWTRVRNSHLEQSRFLHCSV